MSQLFLIDIQLDEQSIFWRSAEAAQERRVAVHDLLAQNYFAPQATSLDSYPGPFKLILAVSEGRLVMTVMRADDIQHACYVLGMASFRKLIRDYHAICESYFETVPKALPHMLETIDMARRGVHNEAAERLIEKLSGKIALDFDTARRLFTLICILHIKG